MEGNLISTLILLVATCLSRAAGQPVGCTQNDHCGSGYYCVKEAWMCRKCIECADFKRNPPLTPMKCVTSVVDCGSCFDGLVENVQGDLQEPCVPDDAGSQAYMWVGVGLGALLLLLLVAVAVVFFMLRHTDFFRILASTRTSVQSGCVNGAAATAPELPPPYNTLYSPVRPDSPAAPPLITDEGSASPFLKRPPPAPARETAGNQAAFYYNNPNYVRGPHLPSNHRPAEREPEPEFLQDDTTAESPWTPSDTANNNATDENSESSSSGAASVSGSGSGSGSGVAGAPLSAGLAGAPLSAGLAAARATTLLRPPCQDAATPTKQPRLRQDTNNNRNNREAEEDAPRPRASGPTVNILVNVQQLHDVKL